MLRADVAVSVLDSRRILKADDSAGVAAVGPRSGNRLPIHEPRLGADDLMQVFLTQAGGVDPRVRPVALDQSLKKGVRAFVDCLAPPRHLGLGDTATVHGLHRIVHRVRPDALDVRLWIIGVSRLLAHPAAPGSPRSHCHGAVWGCTAPVPARTCQCRARLPLRCTSCSALFPPRAGSRSAPQHLAPTATPLAKPIIARARSASARALLYQRIGSSFHRLSVVPHVQGGVIATP